LKLMSNFLADGRKVLVTAIIIVALAAALRLYNIQMSFSNNGIDEGIMIERTFLVSRGYGVFTDTPCDQAPLGFYLGAFTNGDVVSLRTLSAAMSLVAIVACMEASRRIRGGPAMLLTGLLLAVDFGLLRESRLFSIDGMSAYFLAGSLLLFVIYIQRSSRAALVASGLLVGLSATAKLFGVLGLVGMAVFLLIEGWKDGRVRKTRAVDIVLLGVMASIPMIAFMLALGPSEMIEGMVFSQSERSFDPFQKLAIPAFLGLNLAYVIPLVYTRAMWRIGRETRMLLCVSYVILAFMIFQPLVFFHHLVILSPSLSILAGTAISVTFELEKGHLENVGFDDVTRKRYPRYKTFLAVSMVGIVVSAGISACGLVLQQEERTVWGVYSGYVEELTEPGDWVISGDPLIPAIAHRGVPPDVVNVAYLAHPLVTLEDIQAAVEEYNVTVVVVCYMLNDIPGLTDWLASEGFNTYPPMPPIDPNDMIAFLEIDDKSVLDFFQEGIGPVHLMVKD